MVGFITFLLLIAWVIFSINCSKILYGYSYKDLYEIMNNEDIQLITEFAKELGIIEENSVQIASKCLYTCIAVVICFLIAILIIRKGLLLLEKFIDRKNALADALNEQKIRNLTTTKEKVKQLEQFPRTSENNIEIINQLSYLDDDTDDGSEEKTNATIDTKTNKNNNKSNSSNKNKS